MTLHDDFDWTLLARYLAGDATPTERDAIERWASASPQRTAELTALRRWWNASRHVPSADRVDTMWHQLAKQLREDDSSASTPAPQRQRVAPRFTTERTRWTTSTNRWGAIAAAIAATIVGAATVIQLSRDRTEQAPAIATAAPREYATARGEHKTVNLVDGTRVRLGYASRLVVQPFGPAGKRELRLEGEAVFDVVHDERRPFIVHAGNSITEDLGTVFSIRAYPGAASVRVVVMSGSVALRSDSGRDSVVLTPGQLGRLDTTGRLEVEHKADTSAALDWLKGRVVFQSTPLSDVAAELSRRFDVDIRISDSTLARSRITIDSPLRSLPELLDAATMALQVRRRADGSVIVIER
jgi:transmembrane sensor